VSGDLLEQVLSRARTQGARADALLRDATVLTLSFEAGRLKGSSLKQEAGLNLRVLANGRTGVAGTTDLSAPDDVVSRAFASANEGEKLELDLPGGRAMPTCRIYDERAASLGVEQLAELGRGVVERLKRPGWQVTAQVERQVETSRFANSAGGAFEQQASAVVVSAEVTRVKGDDGLMAYDTSAASGAPDAGELERLATRIITKLERSETIVPAPDGRLKVLFTAEGLEPVLMPLRQALSMQKTTKDKNTMAMGVAASLNMINNLLIKDGVDLNNIVGLVIDMQATVVKPTKKAA